MIRPQPGGVWNVNMVNQGWKRYCPAGPRTRTLKSQSEDVSHGPHQSGHERGGGRKEKKVLQV